MKLISHSKGLKTANKRWLASYERATAAEGYLNCHQHFRRRRIINPAAAMPIVLSIAGSGTAELDASAICAVSPAIVSAGPADTPAKLTDPWLLYALSISV